MPEHPRWPLLGRPVMIDAICLDLLGRPAVTTLITGMAGAGKSTLLDELAARLRARHRRVVVLIGIAELSSVPLGAFLPLLATSSPPDVPVDERLRALLDQLGRDVDRSVLLVDDASFLDDISAAAVYQLVRVFGMPTVLTARDGTQLPAALDHLRHEGALVARSVPPLTHEELAGLLTRRLRGNPTPELLNSAWARTEGNPLFLRGLVEGALARAGPELTAHGLEVQLADVADVGELADRTIGHLDDEELRAAQLLALTGGLGRGELAAADALVPVERLRAAGLTTTTDDDRVRLIHPLFADAARRSLDDDRAERAGEAAELLARGDDAHRLAAVRLLLDAGITPDERRLAEAATTADRAGDHRGCDELAAAAMAAGVEGAELRWTRAHSLSLLGRLDDADNVFAEGWSIICTAEERALGISRNGEHLAFRRHDLPAALALAEAQGPLLPDSMRSALEPEVRVWRVIAGRLDDSAVTADGSEAPPALRLRAAMAAVLTESLGGRGDLARASAEQIAAIDREFGVLDPIAAAIVHLGEFFGHLARADGVTAWDSIERQRSGPLSDAAGLWSYTLGVFCWYAGRLGEGERLAALAVDQLRWRDPTGLLGAAIALRALLAQALKREAEAVDILSELMPAQLNEPRAAMLHAEYTALRLASAGQASEASVILAQAGGGAIDSGYGLVGALTLSLAIRLGHPEVVRDGLERAAASADRENLLIPALRDLAVALGDLNADALIAAASVVTKAGMAATARDALGHAERVSTGEARRRLARAAADLGFTGDSSSEPPTAREREVARLAARRLSNAEIAAELRVSVRTVENHLTRFYAKTGTTRQDLRSGS